MTANFLGVLARNGRLSQLGPSSAPFAASPPPIAARPPPK